MTDTAAPKATPLNATHRALGATMVDFGGWDMPLKYASDTEEHRAVRNKAGIFDLSHMGEVFYRGPQAGEALDFALVGKYSTMKVGKAKYGVIVDADGHLMDDLITYRLAEDVFMVVPNASNTPVVAPALIERAAGFDVTLTNETDDWAIIAVQGPEAEAIITRVVEGEGQAQAACDLGYYAIMPARIVGVDMWLARTGYTGEDGFEIFAPSSLATQVWEKTISEGDAFGLVPCGLAARDSLRLEAGMPLFGHEMSNALTPFDAGFGRLVAFKTKEDFFARGALEAAAAQEPTRVLLGLTSQQRRPARAGYPVVDAEGAVIGQVTSGLPSVTLGYPIAMAYVDRNYADVGTELSVDVRGKALPFVVTATPFYTRRQD
ncbi:MAG: glycine cleavage system aminomethyltransferase GcvT [Actinomycetaceae bacterium]|nr:glycine cleavage system aminomethyltransferase GcvT [Actinomycetaceae bacterium]